jgi:hypothetical protein
MPRPRLCACGCGRPLTGRKGKRFYSPGCRVKGHRRGAPQIDSKVPAVAENPLQGQGPVSQDGGVTLTDTKPADVYCAGCGSLMPKLEGPLPVAAYCSRCVNDGSRPS